jgi:hypothetical protein
VPKPTLYVHLNTLTELHKEYRQKDLLAIASAKDTPEATLRLLAGDEDFSIHGYALKNSNMPQDVVDNFVSNAVKLENSAQPATPTEMAAAHQNRYTLRLIAAENTNLSLATQKLLAEHPVQQQALASNKNLDPSVLKLLLEDAKDDAWLFNSLAQNPSLTSAMVEEVYSKDKPDVWQAIAGAKVAPEHILQEIYDNISTTENVTVVAYALAKNTKAPQTVLAGLAKDSDSHIRQMVAANRGTSREIILELLNDTEYWVRSAAVRNSRITAADLDTLLQGSNDDIAIAAESKKLPADKLQALFEKAFADNSKKGRALFEKLVVSKSYNEHLKKQNIEPQVGHPYSSTSEKVASSIIERLLLGKTR